MFNEPALLALADGKVYHGFSIGAAGTQVGELVFNTAMTGYQEVLSDPSYARQIITFTTAHLGNTGCNDQDLESSKIWAAGVIMREYTSRPSNYRSQQNLAEWLKRQNTIGISGIDTRALTQHLRENGSIAACITTEAISPASAVEKAKNFTGLCGMDLAQEVSRQTIERWHQGLDEWTRENTKPARFNVIAYDFGVKHNILRILHDLGCHITLVPAKTPAKEVLSLNPQGILLSNGPGDPEVCEYAIRATQQFLALGIPILGICLGFQILALACDAKTTKMKFGHHGANHPVIELSSQRVFITSQNHGFSVDETTLPECLQITHRSLFDNSLQGIKHTNKPALGFQGHPEASPGPHDIEVIFDPFIKMMEQYSA